MSQFQSDCLRKLHHKMSQIKRVAVIGAGPSGLVSIKTLLTDGHDVTCFDMNPTIGGLWNYEAFKTDVGYQVVDDYDQPVQAVYKSLLLNSSSDISAFSDFPMKEGSPSFLNHWEYFDYLNDYADHFGLKQCIKLDSKVTKLVKTNNGWTIYYESKSEGVKSEDFPFVVIATGCFKFLHVPKFKGMTDRYKGIILHTAQVRDEIIFKDKRVLVIGGSHSGCEVAISASKNHAAKLYLCGTSNPKKKKQWVMNRYYPGEHGDPVPWDHSLTRFEYLENKELFQARLKTWMYLIRAKDDKAEFCFPGDRTAITDVETLLASLDSGKLENVNPVDHFELCDVLLVDGTRLSNIDFVVMGTGFRQRYPFLDKVWKQEDQGECQLYKHILYPEVEMDGLAFMLYCQTHLSYFNLVEMQARWITKKLIPKSYDDSGSLFTATERMAMQQDINATHSVQPPGLPYNKLTDMYEYIEKLAEEIGCLPPSYEELNGFGDEGKLLAVALRYGPILGAHYRIQGPGKWEGAKDWIIHVAQRVLGWEKINEHLKNK